MTALNRRSFLALSLAACAAPLLPAPKLTPDDIQCGGFIDGKPWVVLMDGTVIENKDRALDVLRNVVNMSPADIQIGFSRMMGIRFRNITNSQSTKLIYPSWA